MQSLVAVFATQGVEDNALVSRVESFLSLDDMGSWRQTSRQAFQDVEAKVREENMNLGSVWYHRAKNFKCCEECGRRFSYTGTTTHAKHKLDQYDFELYENCPDCFVKKKGLVVCVNCKNHFFKCNSFISCYGCDASLCTTCGNTTTPNIIFQVHKCNSCQERFCEKCSNPICNHLTFSESISENSTEYYYTDDTDENRHYDEYWF
jgi:hypothetical protein